jgi:hypothetical protein
MRGSRFVYGSQDGPWYGIGLPIPYTEPGTMRTCHRFRSGPRKTFHTDVYRYPYTTSTCRPSTTYTSPVRRFPTPTPTAPGQATARRIRPGPGHSAFPLPWIGPDPTISCLLRFRARSELAQLPRCFPSELGRSSSDLARSGGDLRVSPLLSLRCPIVGAVLPCLPRRLRFSSTGARLRRLLA